MDDNKDYQSEPIVRKVGGWLLLFCLSLTIFSPLLTIIMLLISYSEVSQYFYRFPGLMHITVIDTVLSLALTIFSIYAGIALWSIKRNAVRIAKTYLLVFLGYVIVAVFLPFLADLPSAANEVMIAEGLKGAFRSFIYFFIWFSYLNKSKRVKATYSALEFADSSPVINV